MTRQDKTRQDKTRQDKTRQDKTRQAYILLYTFIIIQNIKKYNLCCNVKLQHRFFIA